MPPLTRNQLKDLALGLLNLIQDEGGFATKTKLLKLLYLADIEGYRDTRSTLTGFDWIFHLYGPWTPQYDELLKEMESGRLIAIRAGNRGDLDTQFISTEESSNLDRLPIQVNTWAAVRRIARLWANESTGEILNYVYFETEPMREARRGEKIDFSVVAPRDQSPLYRRTKSSLDKKGLHAARKRFLEVRRPRGPVQSFTPPTYDEAFSRAVLMLDEDST